MSNNTQGTILAVMLEHIFIIPTHHMSTSCHYIYITLETPYTIHTCIQSQEYRRNPNSVWE